MRGLAIRFLGESHYADVYHGLPNMWNKLTPALALVARELS